ncbi:MAG: IgGFc-binding protein [Candidatus Kapabacteria bacterium]|nr:IgGFc-binding protein [Candidatus Kapabacteria bacterium]
MMLPLLVNTYLKIRFQTYFCLLILYFISSQIAAIADSKLPQQIKTTGLIAKNVEGTEFWLCFEKNHEDYDPKEGKESPLNLELFISCDYDALIKVEIPSIGFKKNVKVSAGTVKNVVIDPTAEIKSSAVVEEKHAVHISSDIPVTVYGLNSRHQTTDAFLGLPLEVLGTEYRVMCYNRADLSMSQFAIVATDDNTVVEITPTVNTTVSFAGNKSIVKLNRGDVYQLSAQAEDRSTCDLTGSLIKSNKKIAVFSGHKCAYIPSNTGYCNHLVEQMPPVNAWGKHFYIGKFQSRSRYTYRVLAHEANTKIFENNKLVRILGPGKYYENICKNPVQITADKPVLVAQFSHGFLADDLVGDPMMILVSPTLQFLNKYRFATPMNGDWEHYINVVIPTKAIKTMLLDNKPQEDSNFSQLGLSRYSVGNFKVRYGTHTIAAGAPFGMYSYGFSHNDAYGTMGGQSFVPNAAALDTLPPMIEAHFNSDAQLIFRDDRVDDSGLRELKILYSEGFLYNQPALENGQAQVLLSAVPTFGDQKARMLVEISDMAENKGLYSLCYSFDAKQDKYFFSLSEGEVKDCKISPSIVFGAFGKLSFSFHSADFSKSGNVNVDGNFGKSNGICGYGGILASYRYNESNFISARLSLENYSGSLQSTDTTFKHFLTDTVNRKFTDVYFGSLIKNNSLNLHISVANEYYIKSYLYLIGGINFAFNIYDNIEFSRTIANPDSYTFRNGSREQVDNSINKLGSFKTFHLSAFAGSGVNFKLSKKYNVFFEMLYNYHLGSLINDGQWDLQQISFILGTRFKL